MLYNNEYIRSSSGDWTIMTNGINCRHPSGGLKILLDKEYNLLILDETNGRL